MFLYLHRTRQKMKYKPLKLSIAGSSTALFRLCNHLQPVHFNLPLDEWGVQPPGEVLPAKLGGGVLPTFQNPYPIYDQNLRFLPPYLRPGQKIDTPVMTVVFHAYMYDTTWKLNFVAVCLNRDVFWTA